MESNNKKPHINVDFFEDLTGDISKSTPKGIEDIGKRIRSLREAKGLSIDEVSKLTGFDAELLASIEKNEVQPQLGTVIKLSKALDSAFSRLVSGVGDRLYSVTRKDEQKIVSRSTSKKGKKKLYTYRSLAPEVKGRHMEALIVQLEENPEKEMSVHEGEEFIYVIEGVAALKIGEDCFDLEPGDSVYYLSTVPHQIASKKGKATILAVLYEG
ncbi:MAG: helix-turn-helix transcriptional regulator [Desulfobacterales bacterium]|uniref:Helix-turn-helix transcriptional regulator n=1 Tax=Candidatus Desulfaltia bathyphila TaxID=2841697 RepID=A0A8J6N3I5_9BACT|nr:helix-turn-helix transcriptional regulator [Candidatus Desulfaltia bathyphila]MBL7194944.1 helix-turn-helix transcriptional regulator [Desulfobacterales bacterium]MBL7207462.1 helix-turn-helix transcriptional regulator [Desulfobacterales bacterium]